MAAAVERHLRVEQRSPQPKRLQEQFHPVALQGDVAGMIVGIQLQPETLNTMPKYLHRAGGRVKLQAQRIGL